MEALIIKIVIAVVIAVSGIVVDNASDHAVSTAIGYENNITHYECKEVK